MIRRSFHLDHAGHSVTVDLLGGHTVEAELLVDGKELAVRHERGTESLLLTGELPDDPPQPFTVRVEHARRGARHAACVLVLAGRELPMPERTAA
ncbi:hypothetical protein [Streptacidiphilus cavernicola]|uniref:Uncharacterized protein n=1 Tax=Streptacidiphilus cavernicola TaxID=3342716 RepID=A0ABV6VVH0_9ACTN